MREIETTNGHSIYNTVCSAMALKEDVFFTLDAGQKKIKVIIFADDSFIDVCRRMPKEYTYGVYWFVDRYTETTPCPKPVSGALDMALMNTLAYGTTFVSIEEFTEFVHEQTRPKQQHPAPDEIKVAHSIWTAVYNTLIK